MRISILLGVVAFVIVLSSCNIAYAKESSYSASYSVQIAPTGNDIGVSKITPASPIYFLKTVRENLEMKLALTPHVKKIRYLEFATRRLREAKSLIGDREDLIQPTLERYLSYLNKLDDKDLSDEEITKRVKESLVVHLEVLENFYEKLVNPKAKLSTRSTIFRITRRSDLEKIAKIPACLFLQKESTNSAIVESERAILLERAQNCLTHL